MGEYVGPWGVAAMFILIVSSIFAGQLAFHNAINRYSFALSRDGLLPAFFNKTNRTGAPWLAGLIQSIAAVAVVLAFGVAGLDPLTQLVILVNSPGVYGIITLQLLVSIAVLVFILKNRRLPRKWFVLPAAIVSILAMGILLGVLVATIDYLTAAGSTVNAIILAVVPAVLIAGIVYALFLRARRPEVFARIGGEWSEQR
jgi:amino acid transporter